MKCSTAVRLSIAALTLLLTTARSLLAQNVTVDEFGNGSANGSLLTSQVASGGLGLQYSLGFIVYPGTVVIHDGTLSGPISDVINFTNTFLFFQSSGAAGLDSPADVTNFYIGGGPRVDIVEQSVGGYQEGLYTPSGGSMPGFNLSGGVAPNFTFVSDVPEPGVCGLVLLSGAMITGWGGRRHFRRRNP